MPVDYLQPTVEDTLDHDEFALYELISAHRASLGLPTVPLSASLTLVAGRKVIDALYNIGTYLIGAPGESPMHGWSDRPYDGRNPATYNVMWEAPQFLGTAYPGYGFEIAVGYTGSNSNTLTHTITPARAVESWLGSPPHRSVIESTGTWANNAWDAVGIGMRAGVAYVWFGREPDPAGLPVVVADDDVNTRLAIAPLAVDWAEDSGAFTFTVTRSGDLFVASSATWTVAGSGATPATASDFTGNALPTNTVSFAAGKSTATITIGVNPDSTVENDEAFSITLSNPSGASLSTATASGIIRNDDVAPLPPPAPPTISLVLSPASVTEDGLANLTYTFSRTGSTSAPLTVNYTVSGTATLGVDYTGIAPTPATKSITFAAGSATATVTVDPTTDRTQEANETVALQLVSGAIYTLGTPSAVTGTIRNDDLIGTAARNTIVGTAVAEFIDGLQANDTLTGGVGPDVFGFRYSHSTLTAPDRITDFRFGTDKIDLFTSTGGNLAAPAGFTRASTNNTAITLSALATAVFTDANGALKGNQALGANRAALVVATKSSIRGTYLFINDGSAGRNNTNDLLVNITGHSDTLPGLGVIPAGFVFT